MEQRGRFLTDETLRTLDLGPPSHLATFSVLGGTIMGAESIRNDTGSQREGIGAGASARLWRITCCSGRGGPWICRERRCNSGHMQECEYL